ncbi:MAG: NAD(+) kinase, partial [Actinobacteria bacterium]|nr:NAD(+) kinase [Actinomycetota bacterium]
MKRPIIVGLLPHSERPEAQRLADEASKRLVELGAVVRVLKSDAPELSDFHVDASSFTEGLDIAVSLGGDGTMLRAVDLVSSAGVPVLGVNVGQLGYLAE